MLQAWHIATFVCMCIVIYPQWFGCNAIHSTVIETPTLRAAAAATALAGWLARWMDGFENVALPLRCGALACVQNMLTQFATATKWNIPNTNSKVKRPRTLLSTFQTANKWCTCIHSQARQAIRQAGTHTRTHHTPLTAAKANKCARYHNIECTIHTAHATSSRVLLHSIW